MLFSTTWANSGFLSIDYKDTSGRFSKTDDLTGFNSSWTGTTACYTSKTSSTSIDYNLNDDYGLTCEWYSSGVSIKDGSKWYVPNMPFCEITNVYATAGGFFDEHKAGSAKNLF